MVASRNSAPMRANSTKIKGRQTSRSSPIDPNACCASAEALTYVRWARGSQSRTCDSPTVSKFDSSGAVFTANEAAAFWGGSGRPPRTSTA